MPLHQSTNFCYYDNILSQAALKSIMHSFFDFPRKFWYNNNSENCQTPLDKSIQTPYPLRHLLMEGMILWHKLVSASPIKRKNTLVPNAADTGKLIRVRRKAAAFAKREVRIYNFAILIIIYVGVSTKLSYLSKSSFCHVSGGRGSPIS